MTQTWLTLADGPRADLIARLHDVLPRLETVRLVIRPATLVDYPMWSQIMTGPRGDLVDGPWSERDAYLDFAQNVGSWLLRGYGLWSIDDAKTGEMLGFVAHCHEEGDPEPEIGYLLPTSSEGRGIATEATLAVRDFAFDTLGQDSLVCYIDPANAPSKAVAAKLGAVRDTAAEASMPADHAGTEVYRLTPQRDGIEAYA